MWRRRLRPVPGSAELRPSGCAPSGARSCRTCPPACAPTVACPSRGWPGTRPPPQRWSRSHRGRYWLARNRPGSAWSDAVPWPGPLRWSAAGPRAWTCGPFPQAGTRPTRARPLSGVTSGKLAPWRPWAGWSAYQPVWSAAGPRSSPPAAVRMIHTSSSFSRGEYRYKSGVLADRTGSGVVIYAPSPREVVVHVAGPRWPGF